ncbi:hypothetical protein QWI17_18020 [Gilvimarinus sp. SDUM040013]|uniref:Transmembrane protein n=1 Tax=Gilvimarinus gilvus TaxID=3058038 RepID=A0ABU4RYZ1_9GAMM|nr:hypothetical protein [Gilvimarinus sp. SDUM040013]MDO3387746.1 hypothetical protein [Gilvimarinus sp. SDUM040013]MDX6848813.1 hypothetical protein [Gilvimarinus sp. SDUM040013]
MTAQANKKRGQIQALLLMLVVALPMIAAYTIYHTGWGMPTGTVNKGELVQPPQRLSDLKLLTADGDVWDIDAEDKRWRYVIPGNAECDRTCMDNLYLTRQVHIRLNDKARRAERIYLLLDDALAPELSEHIAAEHPLLRVMRANRADVEKMLAATNFAGHAAKAGRYFLMDQQGFLMLAYHPGDKGGELLKDMKKMLKTSYED